MTIGLGLGVEVKIFKSFGVSIQVVNFDIASMIGDEAAIISSSKDELYEFDITNGYINIYAPIKTRKYTPLFVNVGFFVRLLKKKI